MQYRPNRLELLKAVGSFLAEEVRPAIADPALAFRVLIAADLIRIVGFELLTESGHDKAQLERLRALLERPDAQDLGALERELAARIRGGDLGPEELWGATSHVTQTLGERLSVTNPRFDLRLDLP
jgi:hypothetical protein